MKSKIAGILALIIFVFFVTSGLFEGIMNFFVWLVTLNATQSEMSMAGEIFVKIASFVVSYTAVGILFNVIGWFNSDAMKLVYFTISTLVSFALCYAVMLLETYLLYIAIVLGILLLSIVGIIIVLYIKNKCDKGEMY